MTLSPAENPELHGEKLHYFQFFAVQLHFCSLDNL